MSKASPSILPNLCQVQSVFGLVLVGELLALALALSQSSLYEFDWLGFGLFSFSIQWIILLSASFICSLRSWFDRHGAVIAGVVSFLLVMTVATIVFIAGQWLQYGQGYLDGWNLLSNLIVTAIIAGIMLRYLFIQQQLRNQQQAELTARVQALQSRIRPHFLFNSLNSIASLIDIDPTLAEKLIVDLSQLFRASLNEASLVPLDQEVKLCQRYVDIEQVRLGDRLAVDWQTKAVETIQVPSLILQPLLENAIYHGIQPLVDGGKVTVTIGPQSDNAKLLLIQVENPYREANQQEKQVSTADKHNGIALDNIRHRLHAYYGKGAKLEIIKSKEAFKVRMLIPFGIEETSEVASPQTSGKEMD